MLGTNMFVGVLLLAVSGFSYGQKYQSSHFEGIPDTDLRHTEQYTIPDGVCKQVLPIPSPWVCMFGKNAMEMTVLDYEPYAAIDFNTELNKAIIVRVPSKYDCHGKAIVSVRYSCRYFNDKTEVDVLNPNVPSYLVPKHVKVPYDARELTNVKVPNDANVPNYLVVPVPVDANLPRDPRVPSDAKIPKDVWVARDAIVPIVAKIPNNARASGDARVPRDARVPSAVPKRARVPNDARVPRNAKVPNDAKVPRAVRAVKIPRGPRVPKDITEHKGSMVRKNMNVTEPHKAATLHA